MYWDPAYGGERSGRRYANYPRSRSFPYGMLFYGSYHAFRSGLRYSSSMRYYADYYKNTGKHHNTKYYTGYRYWR